MLGGKAEAPPLIVAARCSLAEPPTRKQQPRKRSTRVHINQQTFAQRSPTDHNRALYTILCCGIVIEADACIRAPSMAQSEPSPSPSPSPPPQVPTAQTPGRRATTFVTLYDRMLDNTLQSMTYEHFADCFPTIAKNSGNALRSLHGDMVTKLGEFARVSEESRCFPSSPSLEI
jgi:hypothetical protein